MPSLTAAKAQAARIDVEANGVPFVVKGQVPLMTIHKSKGMEFHTMLFFGLDERSWRSLTPEGGEELNSFFVALTHAEQRDFFTCCTARGGPIEWLERLLGQSVPKFDGVPPERT